MPTFERYSLGGIDRIAFEPTELILAGWTGRDPAAVEHQIAELAALGVRSPTRIPTFYPLDPALLASAVPRIHVLGERTSGEVEVVLLSLNDGLWVGLGSDHTDRAMLGQGIAISKQLCRKPIAAGLWRFDDVSPHWDQLVLRAHILEGGDRRLYMEAPLAAVRRPEDLIHDYAADLGLTHYPRLPVGTVMFCGAIGAIGGIRPAPRFEMELADPVLGRSLRHAYDIEVLRFVV
jgi:Protein of unknown function (DUF2848)